MAVLSSVLTDQVGKQPSAPTNSLFVTVTPTAAVYTPTGEAFDAEGLFKTLGGHNNPPAEIFFNFEPKGDYALQYDRAAKKLKYYLISTGAEAGAVNLSVTPGAMRVMITAQ